MDIFKSMVYFLSSCSCLPVCLFFLQPFESEIDKIKANIMNQYTSLERQHQEFADHVLRQLASSHSDKSDEASISDNHHSQYGSSHHPMQVCSH